MKNLMVIAALAVVLVVGVPLFLLRGGDSADDDVTTTVAVSDTTTTTVPPGTSSGAKLRLKGLGIQGGDLHARIRIVVPKEPSDEQRALFEQLRDLEADGD